MKEVHVLRGDGVAPHMKEVHVLRGNGLAPPFREKNTYFEWQ